MLKVTNEIFIVWQLLNLQPETKNIIFKKLSNPIETTIGNKKLYTKYELLKKIGNNGYTQKVLNKFIEIEILKEKDSKYFIDIVRLHQIWEDSIYPEISKRIKQLMPPFA